MSETIAGRYRVLRPLGRGGMSVVELAEDEELGRVVAVKRLAEHLAREPDVRERFLREARLAARLAHPNVVRVYDVGDDHGRPYIVMEHVEGETLADLLHREGPLASGRAVDLVVQVCLGLEAAHVAGLVHRDVKPENLLLRPDGTVKVTDFGIARAAEATRLTRTGTVLGTVAYLAPEQALGEDVTPAADVYAVGAVLYEALTGRPPRRVVDLGELVAELERPVEPVRELAPATPVELERVVMHCLARLPAYRPASAGAVAGALRGERREKQTEDAAAVRHASRRRLLVAGVAAAVVAAAAAGVGFGLATRGPSRDGTPPPARPRAVRPVPPASDPAQQARNLSAWLRANSR